MREISRVSLTFVLCLVSLLTSAKADTIASCNYTFPVGPYEDRGSVQVLNLASGMALKIVQDDDVVQYTKVTVSTASGDQARDLVKQDGNFRVFTTQAHIFVDEIDHVDEYAALPSTGTAGSAEPQARFFAFFGKNQRYLGGFGMNGKTPFVCDWV